MTEKVNTGEKAETNENKDIVKERGNERDSVITKEGE